MTGCSRLLLSRKVISPLHFLPLLPNFSSCSRLLAVSHTQRYLRQLLGNTSIIFGHAFDLLQLPFIILTFPTSRGHFYCLQTYYKAQSSSFLGLFAPSLSRGGRAVGRKGARKKEPHAGTQRGRDLKMKTSRPSERECQGRDFPARNRKGGCKQISSQELRIDPLASRKK